MRVGLKDLQNLTRQLYLKLQYPEAQTETILDVLSYAHRRGNFQSLIQEVAVGTPRFNAHREIVVEKETSLSCLIDAGGNIGISALNLAADLLVSKAKTSGFAIVGIHNSSPPGTGPAGYYAERIAQECFIGIVFCGSSKMVAPSGSSERAFGSIGAHHKTRVRACPENFHLHLLGVLRCLRHLRCLLCCLYLCHLNVLVLWISSPNRCQSCSVRFPHFTLFPLCRHLSICVYFYPHELPLVFQRFTPLEKQH
jgi:Malate/L-lactate dehydrogenase